MSSSKLSFSPVQLGDRTVTYFVSDTNGCKNSEEVDYYVASLPEAQFSLSDSLPKGVFFRPSIVENSNAKFEYTWTIGSPVFLKYRGYNPTMKIDSMGTFDVSLSIKNTEVGCLGSYKKNVQIYLVTGISAKTGGFSIYPNPSQGLIFIDGLNSERFEYRIWSSTGQLMLEGSDSGNAMIDMSTVNKGTYLIQIISGVQSIQQAILIN